MEVIKENSHSYLGSERVKESDECPSIVVTGSDHKVVIFTGHQLLLTTLKREPKFTRHAHVGYLEFLTL